MAGAAYKDVVPLAFIFPRTATLSSRDKQASYTLARASCILQPSGTDHFLLQHRAVLEIYMSLPRSFFLNLNVKMFVSSKVVYRPIGGTFTVQSSQRRLLPDQKTLIAKSQQ